MFESLLREVWSISQILECQSCTFLWTVEEVSGSVPLALLLEFYYISFSFNIVVLLIALLLLLTDHPDPPKYVTAEDVGHDSLALTWKPPVWDGGSNITNYLVEKREHPMSSWIRVGNTRLILFTTKFKRLFSTLQYNICCHNLKHSDLGLLILILFIYDYKLFECM